MERVYNKRVKPVIGQMFDCGEVTRVGLKPEGKSRCTRVEIKCSKCERLFTARWVDIKNGVYKSCNCLRKQSFKTYWTNKAAGLSKKYRKQVFEHHELLGEESTAKQFGISRYLAGFVWLLERERILTELGQSKLLAISQKYLTMSNLQAQSYFSMTQAKLLAIYRMAKRIAASIAEECKNIQNPDYTLSEILRSQIAEANEIIANRHSYATFTQRELNLKKKSRYRWAYKMVSEMTPLQRECYPGARDFWNAAQATFAKRMKTKRRIIQEWTFRKKASLVLAEC